jgi:hypothetical protein
VGPWDAGQAGPLLIDLLLLGNLNLFNSSLRLQQLATHLRLMETLKRYITQSSYF